MVGQAYAHTLLAAMRQETIVLFNKVSNLSRLAGIDNQDTLLDIEKINSNKNKLFWWHQMCVHHFKK
mgnify:CR=1 FL=1